MFPFAKCHPSVSGCDFASGKKRLQCHRTAESQPDVGVRSVSECEVHHFGVATRQSTDVVAIDDRDIAAALHYIREHACRGLSVAEVVKHNPVSRSTLERQVRKYLGRTPQEEIRHVQIKRVRELLLTTDLPAERIAILCGFEHPEYMHVVFKRITGMTTGDFRRQAKP